MTTKGKLEKSIGAILAVALILSLFMMHPTSSSSSSTNVYVDPPNITFYTDTTTVGTHFNISVKVSNVTNLYGWQVKLYFDPTQIEAAKAWIPSNDPAYVFYGRTTFSVGPIIDNVTGYVMLASIITVGSTFNGSGLLTKIEFVIMLAPTKFGSVSSVLNIDNAQTKLSDPGAGEIATSKTNGSYSYNWAVPTMNPYLAVDPTTTTFGPYPPSAVGEQFDIKVYIKELDAVWGLTNATIWVDYNTTLIDTEVANVTIAPAWEYAEVNVIHGTIDYVKIFVNTSAFLYGDVLVATIKFKIMYQGTYPAVDISPLSLNGTLFDHILEIPQRPEVEGQVRINGFSTAYHDIAITNITVSSRRVTKGEVVTMTVTLENQGNFTENFTLYITCGQTRNLTLAPQTSTITIFYLDTSNWTEGNHTLWALVPPCFGDQDPYDNIYIDGVLEVIYGVHDVAIISVTAAKTVVGQGYTVEIRVKIANEGNFNETFYVKLHGQGVWEWPIGGQMITLSGGATKTLVFLGETRIYGNITLPKGNYTIIAEAFPVPGETDIMDNTLTDGSVVVAMVGDISSDIPGVPDGKVDMVDMYEIAKRFGLNYPDPRFVPNYDVDGDYKIDMVDMWIVAKEFGKIEP